MVGGVGDGRWGVRRLAAGSDWGVAAGGPAPVHNGTFPMGGCSDGGGAPAGHPQSLLDGLVFNFAIVVRTLFCSIL